MKRAATSRWNCVIVTVIETRTKEIEIGDLSNLSVFYNLRLHSSPECNGVCGTHQ